MLELFVLFLISQNLNLGLALTIATPEPFVAPLIENPSITQALVSPLLHVTTAPPADPGEMVVTDAPPVLFSVIAFPLMLICPT